MFDEEDLDIWFDDEAGSHWFKRLVFLVASVAVVYYYARAKTRQLSADETIQSAMPDTEAEVETDTFAESAAVIDAEDLVTAEFEDERDVVDVIAAEFAITEDANFQIVEDANFQIVEDEYVIDDEEEITEDTEIDLALEEAIENGDDLGEDEDEDPLEGVLAETDDEELEEQVLEPSPAPSEPPKWVAPIDGECPPGHPVKARFSTGRYHVPGDRGYDKITPDCCYENTDDAKADGFTHSRWS